MAATLSPVMATTLRVINIGSIQISHLAAKTCKLVKLHAECLQLSLVHVAVHRQEEQQHEVLLEALAVEDPLREAILHDGEGGEGAAPRARGTPRGDRQAREPRRGQSHLSRYRLPRHISLFLARSRLYRNDFFSTKCAFGCKMWRGQSHAAWLFIHSPTLTEIYEWVLETPFSSVFFWLF